MYRRWLRATGVALCASLCLLAWAEQDKTPKKKNPRLPRRAAVDAYILGPTALVAGSSASYRVAVHWASSPKRSGPLPDAEVALSLVDKNKRELHLIRGRTSGQGSADLRFVVPRTKTGPKTLKVRVRSSLGKAAREQQVRVFPGGRVLLTTDKKLYQPSQLIHIRALALRSIDLKPVAGRPVRIRVVDPKGNAVFDHRGRTSRFGIASADFQLADEINLGHYTIEAWAEGANKGGRSSKRVEVKRYVLPKFKVTVEAERSYYRPGETLRGTVRCRYFFGKPVAGAKVALEVRHRLGRGVVSHALPATAARVTDAAGRHPFEVKLSSHASRGDVVGEVRVTAKVVDTANHREAGDLSLPLTASPLQLSVVPENDRLVPGVHNRVHVVAGYPDGTPAKNATVSLGKASKRTDGLGVASFQLMPRASGRVCGGGDDDDDSDTERKMALTVNARDALGQRGAAKVCAPIAPRRAVLVRPARSLVTPGQPVELELFAAPARTLARGQVFVDVVKAGQTLATFTRALARGRSRVSFVPDAALFGLLELRAYRLRPDGQRVGTSRMVYVDHPGELKIKAHADRAVYRPGGRARLTFQVSDSRTGDGVEAALGLLGVDEAVVAMGGLERSAPKVFFTLANQAKGEPDLDVVPGGRDLEHWVTSAEAVARRDRAADVLLAAVQPADVPVWETNPWKERREAWEQLAPELVSAAVAFMRDHSVGIKTAKGWRFHPELLPRMARAKAIKPEKVTDPWRRTVRPWHLHETDASFTFNSHARRLAPEKLSRIYDAFDEVWEQLKLKRERMRKLPRRKWPLVLPRDLPQRLVALGKLKPADIVDPWGQPYRVGFNPRLFVNPYRTGLVSRYLIHSAGPDGVSGTKDDVGPSGPRVAVNVFGRDSALGTDAEIALGGLIGNAIGESYGVGGLGLAGIGRGGGGGSGSGYGFGVGRLGGIGGRMPARVRSVFPETLLWHPELITDRSGRATLDVEVADSITTWRVQATGSTTNGLLGSAELTLRVFQDFFVDIDVPVSLTQKDRVSVPVTVYNYLKTPQRVTLRLQREKWFVPAGPLQQTVDLGPSEVKVRYFPIVAHRVGRQDLTVHASAAGKDGARVADAVRRSTLVEPDGIEHASARAGSLRDQAAHEIEIPPGAISGTERVLLAMYSGPMGQTLDGLEGMLRKPYGCFEQTSSTTYPNVLVLDYLKRTGKATPEVKRRAQELINEGYQRLVSFEVAGGGFSWFGNAPANKILTAYGLMEFHDMSRVHPVDPKVISRTQRWLAGQQKPDGSWGPDGYAINEGATNNFRKDLLRITAYIAHALRHTGYRGSALTKALRYVRRHARSARDPYTLAVLGNLLARDNDKAARWVRARLWAQRRSSDKGLHFEAPRATLTHGAGRSGGIETTALAALAYLTHGNVPAGGERMIESLVASKDSFGSWHSTQATILSLRALLLDHQRSSVRTAGEVQVLVDNRPAGRIRIKAGEDRARQLDLTSFARAGRHRIAMRFAGKGSLQYNLVGRYWLPRRQGATERPASKGSLAIRTRFDRHKVQRDGKLQLDVEVTNRGRQRVEMPLVSLALPPGFAVKEEAFTALVKAGVVDKVQRIGSRAVLYLTRLGAGQALRFAVPLRGRYPLRVQARPSVVYEYYRPENRGESEPKVLQVL